jgi:hypothetical protein
VRRRVAAAAIVALAGAGALVGCSPGSSQQSSAQPSPSSVTRSATISGTPYVGYPDAIVVLGHSGSTGESSDPTKPVGFETRANSWVTGTNPTVNSLYLRILAKHSPIRGHNISLSHGGATVADALGQAQEAVSQQPKNALVVIQLVDNDTVCPATQADYDAFQMQLESVLAELDHGLPTSRVFVVSHYGTATKDFKTLTPVKRRHEGGTGPCAFIDPKGRLVPKELDRIEHIGLGYEAALKAGCLKFARCRYDDRAFHNAPVKAEFTSPIDVNHFSIAGHAQAAAVAWRALQKAGIMPAPR